MLPGSRTWRACLGSAAIAVVVPAGCHSVPVARFAPTPNRPQSAVAEAGRAALLPATVALEAPAEMGSMEPVRPTAATTEPSARLAPDPRPIVAATATPPASAPQPPAETPLLDAALQRANGIESAIAEAMSRPAAEPATPPAAGPEAAERLDPKPATPSPAPMPTPNPAPAEPAPTTAATAPAPAAPVEPPPASPEDQWRDGVRRLAGLARSRTAEQGPPGSSWDLRARVLAWLAEPDIDPEADPAGSRDLRAVLRAMGEPRPAQPAAIEQAIHVLEDRTPFSIADLQVCTKVSGFGDYEPIEPPARRAGQQVVLYAEIDGFRREPAGDRFRTRISGQVEFIPDGATAPAWSESLGTGAEVCRRRRSDLFFSYLFRIPKTLPPGRYNVRLTEHDLVADRTASRDVPLVVVRD